jgi:diguanylate cyclase (GGDEF)-like protein
LGVAVLTGGRVRLAAVSPAARTLRASLVAALVGGFALVWGPEGFWACVPGALVLASTEPSPRAAVASAALVVLVAAIAAPPPLLLAALVVPASLGVLLALRARLERERDAMRRFALRDPLTGLANRRALDERLGYEIARHTRQGEVFAVLALDLDGFKAVNDRFGHDAGDEVLCETADALVGAVRAQDTVVRLGGDEFCVLAPQTGEAAAEHLADRVRAALAGVTTGVSGLSASIGAAVFPADGTTPDGLLAAADQAAIVAKRHRRRERRAA